MNHSDNDAKHRILQAAKRLFARQGFNATSVREICEEAGANVALVSYHFGGKDQLFKAIFDQYFRPERYEPFEKLIGDGDPAAALEAFIRVLVAYRFDEPEMMSLSFQELTTESKRAGILRDYLFPVWGLLRRILEEGKQSSVFRMESVDYAMSGIMGMVLFPPKTVVFEPLLQQPFNREEMTRHMTCYVFRMLGVRMDGEGESV